jgi:S1-C subfamily serine protease
MRIKKYLIVIITLIFFGCATKPKKIPSVPFSYTDEKIRETQIIEIEKDINSNPVKALERACLLYDAVPEDKAVNDIYNKACQKVYDDFMTTTNAVKKWQLFVSLQSSGFNKFEQENLSEDFFYSNIGNTLIGNNVTKENITKTDKKISDFIDGTVTIWVDLGVKVENGRGFAERVIGSGFFIDKRGYLVTNNHVIEKHVDPKYQGFSKVYIKMSDDPDTRIPAKVIGWDKALDLALLKAEINPLYVFNLGSSSDISIGEKIYAIGSPVGLEKTMTSGIVSAFDRKLFSVASVLQIDAAINTGNSGGPIIDSAGNVQAVVFAGMLDFEGLNFAIPVEYLKLILPYLYNGGKVEHSWCGIYGRTKKDAVSNSSVGVEVLYTMTLSSSSTSGLKKGDIIIECNGNDIKTVEQMQNMMLYYLPNTLLSFKYIDSEGKFKTCRIRTTERPDNPCEVIFDTEIIQKAMFPLFGMELTSVSENNKNFMITSIIPGSAADENGFSVNDPVQINTAKILKDNNAVYAEIYTKKRKNGYLDIALAMLAPLDSPFIF